MHASPKTLLEISAAVGAVLPVVISLIKAAKWSAKAQSVIALVICAVAATVTAYASGQLHGLDVGAAFAVVYGATQASFHGLYKPTGADDWLSRIGFVLPQPTGTPVP